MVERRRCPDCGEEKPASEFRKNRSRPDGLSHYCRSCFRKRDKKGYQRRQLAKGKRLRERPDHVPDGHKYCPSCKSTKPHSEWDKARKQPSGFYPYCKQCRSEKGSESYFRRTYGLSKSEVRALLERQSGKCGICQVNPAKHLDHCHKTNAVRGMLCFSCNAAIGHLRDDPEILHRAASYLAYGGCVGQRETGAIMRARLERILGVRLPPPDEEETSDVPKVR